MKTKEHKPEKKYECEAGISTKYSNGDIVDYKSLLYSDFKNELDLENYIDFNIKSFVKEVLLETYSSHSRQYVISVYGKETKTRTLPHTRIDLFITTKEGNNYIVELKHSPNDYKANISGVTQLLLYKKEMHLKHKKECKMILISTVADCHTMDFISYYNLPIKFIVFKKGVFFLGQSLCKTKDNALCLE